MMNFGGISSSGIKKGSGAYRIRTATFEEIIDHQSILKQILIWFAIVAYPNDKFRQH